MKIVNRIAAIAILCLLSMTVQTAAHAQFLQPGASNSFSGRTAMATGTVTWYDTRMGPVIVRGTLYLQYYCTLVGGGATTTREKRESSAAWYGFNGKQIVRAQEDVLSLGCSVAPVTGAFVRYRWRMEAVLTDSVGKVTRNYYTNWYAEGF